MKRKDREFLEADRRKRFLRMLQLTLHFNEGGPLVEPLSPGYDLPDLRRTAARLRAGAIVPDDPSVDPRALSWMIERAVEQHLVAETIAADLEIHEALADDVAQISVREREMRERAALHRLKASAPPDDPRVRRMHRARKRALGRSRRKRQESPSRQPKSPRLRIPLRFVVGDARHAFFEPYATNVTRALDWWFPFQIRRATDDEQWRSAEVEWYGWRELQRRADWLLGKTVPHLRCTAAWKGVYVPTDTDPCGLKYIGGDPWPISIGALRNLVVELERFGTSSGLPVDDAGLLELPQKTDEDDLAVLTYAQVLRAAHHAARVRLPLWVVR